MCPPGQHRAFWAAPGSGTEPAPVPWPWPRVRVLCAAWWGGGPGRSRGGGRGQAAWPSRRGLSREGRRRTRRAPVGLRAPTTWGSRLGRRASETQPAGAGPGLCVRGAFLQLCRPAGPPPVCRPGVWVPPPNEGGSKPDPGGSGSQPPGATAASLGTGGHTERQGGVPSGSALVPFASHRPDKAEVCS